MKFMGGAIWRKILTAMQIILGIIGVIALIVDFPVAILCVILILILHLFKKKSHKNMIKKMEKMDPAELQAYVGELNNLSNNINESAARASQAMKQSDLQMKLNSIDSKLDNLYYH